MPSKRRPLLSVKPVSPLVAPAFSPSIHCPDGACCLCSPFCMKLQTLSWAVLLLFSSSAFHWEFVEFFKASDMCYTSLILSFTNIYLTPIPGQILFLALGIHSELHKGPVLGWTAPEANLGQGFMCKSYPWEVVSGITVGEWGSGTTKYGVSRGCVFQ